MAYILNKELHKNNFRAFQSEKGMLKKRLLPQIQQGTLFQSIQNV